MNDLRNYVESIRDDLLGLYNEEWTTEEREEREEQGEPCDLWDYVEQAFDVEYILDSRFRLLGVKLYVALGGPTIHLDTRENAIVGHWGGDRETIYFDYEISDAINEIFEETIPSF